ncbi:hypothetical protein [Chryseobacterium sp. W4I1]|uniref:hypothetical protein n=1 Tax=Chryseobacterium sp. W4I1 TaxID=3042293 RepID=UPI002785BD82|nr:hypothetical protein [Chryseobacterium sp. W4I1]MDQ0781356.1 hypothetical protein [Chryseobacterium sp. W4I1]
MITSTELLYIFGGATVVAPAIVTFLAQRFSDAQNNRWRRKTDEKLEFIKNDLSNKSNVLSNLMDVQKSNYSIGQQRRIEAIEKCWILLSDFTVEFPEYYYFIINKISSDYNLNFKSYLNTIDDLMELDQDIDVEDGAFIKSYENLEKNLRYERPFIGFELWDSISAYKNFIVFTLLFTSKNLENDKYEHWQKNKKSVNILHSSLQPSAVEYVLRNRTNSFEIAISILQSNIIENINDILSGKIASHNTLEYVKLMRLEEID